MGITFFVSIAMTGFALHFLQPADTRRLLAGDEGFSFQCHGVRRNKLINNKWNEHVNPDIIADRRTLTRVTGSTFHGYDLV
jgi:hypothetical protein